MTPELQVYTGTVTKETETGVIFERFLHISVADGAASKQTLSSYRTGLAAYLSWCAANTLDPRAATFDDIQNYRAHLIGVGYKTPTIRLRLVAVRALYAGLQRWGVRPDNPASGVRAPKNKDNPRESTLRKALSPEEARRLLSILPGSWAPHDIRDATIVRLMLFHGLRVGEVSSLMADAVDYQSFSSLNILGKGGKRRTIILNPETRKDLIAWAAAVKHPHIGAPLFFGFDTPGMRFLSVRGIERIVNKYLAKAGLKQAGRSAHALRHTAAVLAVLGGAQREAIAEAFGHASLETTAIYTRAAAAFQENPADAVSRALEKK